MLISPPFLLDRNADETDDQWIDRCMVGGQPGDGAFPISASLGWHGGVHLHAPVDEQGQSLPVRAIADGTVVFVRAPRPRPVGPLDPLDFQAYCGGWTDNGVVVIRHQTAIGEGSAAEVTFYSITLHLGEIAPSIVEGRTVYRKSKLGIAGQIYGESQRKIHLEIVCDDINVVRLVGRVSGTLSLDSDGRTDAVYGELYFYLPPGTHIFSHQPQANSTQGGVPVHTTSEAYFVGLRYAAGTGAVSRRGDLFLTTYQTDGSSIGDGVVVVGAEYQLYANIDAICNSCPVSSRPTPSAVYELLRFGRVIGPDALNSTDVPHWREICYPGGRGWVNLNAVGVRKYSDADFPHWRGWTLLDDSDDQDSRCDSTTLRQWLDLDGNGRVPPGEAEGRLRNVDVLSKMSRVIGKFPTEWNLATVDQRWGWLKTQTEENPHAMSIDEFERLRAHIGALAFWPGGVEIDDDHWHWHPREFIRQFRTCGWLSVNEFAQCIPRRNYHLVGTTFTDQLVAAWPLAGERARRWSVCLNRSMRKYLLAQSKIRVAHFLSQVIEESGYLRLVVETGGSQASYSPWYGRGLIQLTHLGNYQQYGRFRGWASVAGTPQQFSQLGWDPNARIAQSDYACADTAGFYWVCDRINAIQANMNIPADRGLTAVDVLAVSRGINGNVAVERVNGLDVRTQLATYLKYVVGDSVLPAGSSPVESVNFRWRNRSTPPYSAVQHNLNVNLVQQRP